MEQAQRKLIATAIMESAMFFGKTDLTSAEVTSYINILIKFFPEHSADKFIHALGSYMKDSKNRVFPSPSALRSYLSPEMGQDDMAVDVASRVIAAVSKFGWCNQKGAREYVGEIGWKAVDSFGGWDHLCQNLGTEIPLTTFNAQVRDFAKTAIHRAKHGIADRPLEISSTGYLGEKTNPQVFQLGEFMKNSNSLPDTDK